MALRLLQICEQEKVHTIPGQIRSFEKVLAECTELSFPNSDLLQLKSWFEQFVVEDWFHGFMRGEESKRYLGDSEVGTFLVRFSNDLPAQYQLGNFTIEYVAKKNEKSQHGKVISMDTYHTEKGIQVTVEDPERPLNSQVLTGTIHEIISQASHLFVTPFKAPWFNNK